MLGQMRALAFTLFVALSLSAQQQSPPAQPAAAGQAAPGEILTISFADALQRARLYGADLQTANIAALLAREDRIQAKAAMLPQTQQVDEFIYTAAESHSFRRLCSQRWAARLLCLRAGA